MTAMTGAGTAELTGASSRATSLVPAGRIAARVSSSRGDLSKEGVALWAARTNTIDGFFSSESEAPAGSRGGLGMDAGPTVGSEKSTFLRGYATEFAGLSAGGFSSAAPFPAAWRNLLYRGDVPPTSCGVT